MKFILLFAVGLFSELVLSEYKDHPMEKSVFEFSTKYNDEWGMEHAGTIFYIGNNLFVTNVHTLMNSFLIDKSNAHKKISETHFFRYKKEIIPFERIRALDIASDISILELSEEIFEAIKSSLIPLKLASSTKNFNKEGFIYGFTGRYIPPNDFTEGQFFREIRFKGVKEVYGKDSSFWYLAQDTKTSGTSGGPILIDNKVIGVGKLGGDGYNGASSFKEISSLLKKNEKILTLGGLKKRTRFKRYAEQYLNSPQTNSWDKNTHDLLLSVYNKQWFLLKYKDYFESISGKRVEVKTEEKRKKQIIKWTEKSNKIARYPAMEDTLAVDYLKKGDIKKAKEMLVASTHFFLQPLLAHIYIDEGRVKKAIEKFKLSAKGNYAPGLFATALWYFTEERWLKYEKYMKRAWLSGHKIAPYHLSLYYMDKLGVKEFRKKFSKAKWARFSKENILNVLSNETLVYYDIYEYSADEYLKIFAEYKKSSQKNSNKNIKVIKKDNKDKSVRREANLQFKNFKINKNTSSSSNNCKNNF